MSTVDEALVQAMAYHKSGDLHAAEQFYRRVLEADTAHVEALYLLGAVCHGLAKPNEAKARLAQAILLRPDHGDAHHHLAVVLAKEGRFDEAIQSFQQALRLNPNSSEISNNLQRAIVQAQNRKGPGEVMSLEQAMATSEPRPTTGPVPPRDFEHDFVAMKKCKHGMFLYNVHDSFIGRSLDLYGQWCEGELDVLGKLIKPGDAVLDVGANIGTHTVFFAKQVTAQGAVMAFEPQRLVFQNLCANLALNGLTHVIARQQCLGRRFETIQLPVLNPRMNANFGAVSVQNHAVGETVEVVRVDDLRLSRCNLIKVDVEGMECDVLAGARESIARHRPVLFVENYSLERSSDVIAMVDSMEYDAYWQLSSYFDLENYFRNTVNVFAAYHPEANLLCFHRSERKEIRGLPKVIGPHDNWRLALSRHG